MTFEEKMRRRGEEMGMVKMHFTPSETAHQATREDIAKELWEMSKALRQGKYRPLVFGDSKREIG